MERPNKRNARFAFPSLDALAHHAVTSAINRSFFHQSPQDAPLVGIDATCGNGNDTLFMAQAFAAQADDKEWNLIACDIQPEAITRTTCLLQEHQVHQNVSLFCMGHECIMQEIPNGQRITAAMFNLGYLPNGNKSVTTLPATTLLALDQLLPVLADHGIISVHSYGGHAGGKEELNCVTHWFNSLNPAMWTVMCYHQCNKLHNPEMLHLAQKKEIAHAIRN